MVGWFGLNGGPGGSLGNYVDRQNTLPVASAGRSESGCSEWPRCTSEQELFGPRWPQIHCGVSITILSSSKAYLLMGNAAELAECCQFPG